ncbi:MAG: indole-3-glycerol phosphate synthase TrpC [Candidatus Saccharicenans sp.]|nr:indole-3-glycerol phosphate synthase TrpC [Candidatus Saccharicenans sp.]
MNILDKIIAGINKDEEANFRAFSSGSFSLKKREKPRDILRSLKQGFCLIAEVKKSSPSRGLIKEDLDPVELALSYQKAGVAAISVVTEKNFFDGQKKYLSQVKGKVQVPVLRKDFLVHPYQVHESYNLGADFILLIAASLSKENLKMMHEASIALGMEVLVEVHDEEDIEKALELKPSIIGINNRNLQTFQVDFNTSLRLKKYFPPGISLISESAINSPKQIKTLKEEGFSGALIGEYLLRQKDVAGAIKELMNG